MAGYQEKLLFDLVLANLKRIIASINFSVAIDLEGIEELGAARMSYESYCQIMKAFKAE